MKRALCAVVATLAVAGCGIPEEKYNATLDELAKQKAELDAAGKSGKQCDVDKADLARQNGTLKKRLEALGQNMKELETEKGALESEKGNLSTSLEDAKRRMAELQKAHEQAELRAAQFRTLVAKFKSMIDSGKLKVEIRNGLMLVKLADNILFDPGKTDLKKEGKDALKEVGAVLAGINGRKFQVAGHTDNQGLAKGSKYKTNWELSTARAVEVVHFLIDQGGMPGDRLSAAGFADQLPVAANDTDDGRKANRRIEIAVMPNIEDLPPMDDLMKDAK
jgi:chemotaxis protein MotB